ncbi:MAG: tRNA epoxyqueuosine(34) reductase QueG [Hyphomicrobium sp.]
MIDPTPIALKSFLVSQARALGLDAIGVTRLAGPTATAQRLRAFLDAGHHGDMDWMATTAERRADPNVLWPEARTAIMIGHSYAPDENPLDALSDPTRGVVSVYARGRDYHDVLKGKIKQLASAFAKASGAEVKVFVDTAPLMEKPLAAQAGLGWQGKHTNLVSRAHGSWLFLGAILTTAELPDDAAEADHCGSCTRCLDACPTNAFPAPYQLDARRCLAYLSIEHRGHIPVEYRVAMGNRIFGCDDCLAVCPWNKFAEASREAKYAAGHGTDNPPLTEILALDDAAFRKQFAGTPVKRTGRDRVLRNALIAAGNSAQDQYLSAVRIHLADASPVVRAMAVWALQRLADQGEYQSLRAAHEPHEPDAAIVAEWRRDRKQELQ